MYNTIFLGLSLVIDLERPQNFSPAKLLVSQRHTLAKGNRRALYYLQCTLISVYINAIIIGNPTLLRNNCTSNSINNY